MRAKDVMTKNPECCLQETDLREVARLMVENDCGAIPVVESRTAMTLLGVITDRDIVCRAVAEGRNPREVTAGECMSSPVMTVEPGESLENCCELMERHQVRRIPVVDTKGACCGIVTQAHIARRLNEEQTGEVVKRVSRPRIAA